MRRCCPPCPRPPRSPTWLVAARLLLAIGLVLAAAWAARGDEKAEAKRLVGRLGSPSFAQREEATRRLAEIGGPALEALRGAAQGKDAETRRRARALIARIERALFGEVYIFTGHTDDVVAVAVSPDGREAASAANDGTVRVWDLECGEELRTLRGRGKLWAVGFSPDGEHLVAGGQDNRSWLWEVRSGESLREFPLHPSSVRAVAFLPDGKHLTACYDGDLRLWEGRETVRRYSGHTASLMCLDASADGRFAVTGGLIGDNTVRVWDVEGGKEVWCLEGHTERVMGVAFSPDGKRVVSGAWDQTVRVWDVATGKQVRVLRDLKAQIYGVDSSADGKWLVAGGDDGALVLWDAETGKRVRRYPGHTDTVQEVRFTPDSRFLVSGSKDNTVRVWRVRAEGE